jgi:hypothetical protein
MFFLPEPEDLSSFQNADPRIANEFRDEQCKTVDTIKVRIEAAAWDAPTATRFPRLKKVKVVYDRYPRPTDRGDLGARFPEDERSLATMYKDVVTFISWLKATNYYPLHELMVMFEEPWWSDERWSLRTHDTHEDDSNI